MQKPPQIMFKHMETSPALEALINDRIDRLEQIHPRIIGCRVVVEVPHRSAQSAKVPLGIAVEVEIPGRPKIVAKDSQERHEAKEDQTAAVNNAFEAVERQLERIADVQSTEARATDAMPDTGMVTELFPEQGYGFVEVDNAPNLYFTRNAVAGERYDDLEVGMMVGVIRAGDEGPMGPQAKEIRVMNRAMAPE